MVFKKSETVLSLISKIKAVGERASNYFPDISQGLIAYDKYKGQSAEVIESRYFHSYVKHSESFKRWLWGEDVTRYKVAWNGKEYLNYDGGVANPREPKFFSKPRILIREITNPRVYAAFTEDELYNDPSIINVLENKEGYPILTLLAILNSKLFTFYHFNSSPKATKGSFPKILVEDVKNLPLPGATHEQHKKIEAAVKGILNGKASDADLDVSNFEKEIDYIVYNLFGLTKEEIGTVEGESDK
ncbi:hypothetical protein GCM10027578_21790 [Spirosoma luteolum]